MTAGVHIPLRIIYNYPPLGPPGLLFLISCRKRESNTYIRGLLLKRILLEMLHWRMPLLSLPPPYGFCASCLERRSSRNCEYCGRRACAAAAAFKSPQLPHRLSRPH